VRRGTLLATIRSMPDLEVTPAPKSAPQKKSPHKSKRGGVAAMLALTLGAAGIYLWLGPQRSTSASSTAVESTFPLETFVVNLSGNLNGSSQRAYLRVGITLGLAHPLPRNPAEATPTAAVRDTILSVLATAQPDEMLKAEGKRQLKDDLLRALQERVPQLAVENVYFTEFLVQM